MYEERGNRNEKKNYCDVPVSNDELYPYVDEIEMLRDLILLRLMQ